MGADTGASSLSSEQEGQPAFDHPSTNFHNDTVYQWNVVYPPSLDGPNTVGMNARFDPPALNPVSSKRILNHLPCARAEYRGAEGDYLKPSERGENYLPGPAMRETRFHRGFQRRAQSEIRQDAPRLQRELQIQNNRDRYMDKVQQGWRQYREDYTFNLLTGEGHGREGEFLNKGRRLLKGPNAELFTENERELRIRERNSRLRYHGYPPGQGGTDRFATKNQQAQTYSDGFLRTVRESVEIGYPRVDAAKRIRLPSQGTREQFAHLRDNAQPVDYGKTNKTKSQIVL